MRRLRFLLLCSIALFIFNISASDSHAYTIQPDLADFLIESGKSKEAKFALENNSDKVVDFKIGVIPYSAQTESFTIGEIFITGLAEELILKSGESVEIPYTVIIPEDTLEGTYFNVIYVEELTDSGESENIINVRGGVGLLVALQVIKPGTNIEELFLTKSDLSTVVVDKGIPFIKGATIKVSYKNNSNLVFTPIGEVHIFDSENGQLLLKERFNSEKQKVYKNQKIEETYVLGARDSLKALLSNKSVATRVYSQYGSTYLESVASLKGFNLLAAVFIATTVLLGGILLLSSFKQKRV